MKTTLTETTIKPIILLPVLKNKIGKRNKIQSSGFLWLLDFGFFSKWKNHGIKVTSLLAGILCYPSQYLLFKGENNYTVTLIVDNYMEINNEMPPLGSLHLAFPP